MPQHVVSDPHGRRRGAVLPRLRSRHHLRKMSWGRASPHPVSDIPSDGHERTLCPQSRALLQGSEGGQLRPCHAGERDPKLPPFSYRPGDKLEDYFAPPANAAATPDVHGNQVALLQRSKCFRSSPGMSCSTCHDVHRPQRDVTAFVEKCLACHETSQHPMATEIGGRLTTACIDCHMPNRRSRAIEIQTATKPFVLFYRSHAIGIYPEVARAVRSR